MIYLHSFVHYSSHPLYNTSFFVYLYSFKRCFVRMRIIESKDFMSILNGQSEGVPFPLSHSTSTMLHS